MNRISNPHIMILAANFYKSITNTLIQGAITALGEHQVSHEVIEVPGCFELPTALSMAVQSVRTNDLSNLRRPYDGYVILGCVIRGETSHYDLICQQCAQGLSHLAIENRLALGFGVITVDNEQQAWARANQDKGGEAARTCLRMIEIHRSFHLKL